MRDGMPPKLTDIPAFNAYMGTGWDTPDRTPRVVPGAAEAAASHRARLAAALPDRTVVLSAGRAPVRSNDTTYDFRPDSDFYWVTGCAIENAVVVLRSGDATLYIPPPAYPGEQSFWRDAQYGELWVGAAPGLDDWARALGVDVRPLSELHEDVTVDEEVGRTLAELRMDQGRLGGRPTAPGRRPHGRGLRGGRPGDPGRGRRAGGALAPGHIRPVRPHIRQRPWLRVDRRQRQARADAALGALRRAGASRTNCSCWTWASRSTATTPRTSPALSRLGTFSAAQRQVHDLVERAHRAGLAAVRPGRRFTDFHHAADGSDRARPARLGAAAGLRRRGASERASTIAATWCAASATTSASTSTTARVPPRAYKGATWRRAWCSRSSPACTSTPTT